METYQNSKFIINNCVKDIFELPINIRAKDTTIYEVVRLIDKKILFIEDHIERFLNSFQILSINPKLTQAKISEQLQLLIKSNNIRNGNIKFQVQINIHTNEQDFICSFIPHAYPTPDQYKNGVSVSLLKASRNNPNAKTQDQSLRDYTNQIIKNENVYEVILVNNRGQVTEGSRSNIFMIKDNVVKTPQIEDILPGITREKIIQVCNEKSIHCIECQITTEEMLSMEALFITGTSPKVLPICSMKDTHFDVNNPYLRTIMKEFDEMIHKYCRT